VGGLGTNALGTDGKYFYFGWVEDPGDIWVADLVPTNRR
jgi:hypothetical protein